MTGDDRPVHHPQADESRDRENRPDPPRRRERSARYPGVPLDQAIAFCTFLDERGLDGLSAAEIAAALGYSNIKTNTFSARLSSARQFGLLVLKDNTCSLTPLARSILRSPTAEAAGPVLQQAFRHPPLYAELARRLAGKRLPEPTILANLLQNHYQITASAKLQAAETFLASAKFAGALDEKGVFDPHGTHRRAEPGVPPTTDLPSTGGVATRPEVSPPIPTVCPDEVRIDLRLWGADRGKRIRVRAPESMTAESFHRLIEALKLHIRIASPSDAVSDLKK